MILVYDYRSLAIPGSRNTEYGSFRFNLGPGEAGKYHEITAIGMDSVTAGFGKYDLKEIIKEYRSSATLEELDDILTETVGVFKSPSTYWYQKYQDTTNSHKIPTFWCWSVSLAF